MRPGLRLKLFLSLLLTLCAVVLAMVMLMQWSFDRGFRRYVETLEEERLARLGSELLGHYAQAGNWRLLHDDPLLWWRLLRESAPAGVRQPPRLARRLMTQAGPEERDLPPHTFEARAFLLDAAQEPVAGRPRAAGATLQPLTQGTTTVGYLGLNAHRRPGDLRQLRFVQEQERAFMLIGLLFAAVAALIALPLAHRLVRRIVRLAEGTHRLASGRFDGRINDASGDELGQLARDFNHLAQTLEQNEQARRQWVADISHELRTPVAILRGEIEALRDGIRPSTPAAHASLHGETLRLQRLIDDLHQLALADVGALQCQQLPLDLGDLLRDAAADLAPALARQQLTLRLDLPAEPVVVNGDAQRLRQLCDNLLENALKYTDAPGRVELTLRRAGRQALIEVADSAPGVPAAALPRLFERLYRVEGSRSRGSGGAGLGLAICAAIVTAHAGAISAHPSVLGGVRIEVLLPLAGSQ